MFVIKYDKVSMIKFVQTIEKYPALYTNKNQYSKEDMDSAWNQVAIEVGEKDSLCRDKWKSITSCYVRHLKYTAINSKRKPYYLAEYLEFYKPFVYDRIKNFVESNKLQNLSSLPAYLKEALPPRHSDDTLFHKSLENNSGSQSHLVKTENLNLNPEWNISLANQQPSSSKCQTSLLSPSKNCSGNIVIKTEPGENTTDNSQTAWYSDFVNQQSSPSKQKRGKCLKKTPQCSSKKLKLPISNDEDVLFFKSLLPDVARMSSHQKLKLKQEALSIIEDILYASDEINVTE